MNVNRLENHAFFNKTKKSCFVKNLFDILNFNLTQTFSFKKFLIVQKLNISLSFCI